MKKELVRQWMANEVVTADPHMRLHDALRLMNRYQIRAIPVIEDEELVGIVTKRDLLRADTSSVMKDAWDQYRSVGNLPVGKLMSRPVITIREDAHVAKAARVFMENKITALPVLDDNQKMTGILTASDIFRLVLEEVPQLKETILVSDYMTRDVQTIHPNTSLLDAQRLMGVKRIRALPVVQEDLLVGILTQTDVFSAAPSAAVEQSRQQVAMQVLVTPVRFVMTSAPLTVYEYDQITKAAELMLNNKIHSVPVMNKQQALSGILTETDVFALVVKKFL